jgi:hypothetical protein
MSRPRGNKNKCANYKTKGTRVKNKLKRLQKHVTNHPNELQGKQMLETLLKVK